MTTTAPLFARLDPDTLGTYLSPGQRFESDVANELIVARLTRDDLGMLHVVLRTGDGREISAFAEQVEAAIAGGHLLPLATAPALVSA